MKIKMWVKKNRRDLLKILLVFPTIAVKEFTELLATIMNIELDGFTSDSGFYKLYFDMVFSRMMSEGETLQNCMFNLAPSLVFAILFGVYIYHEINVGSIYSLIRYRDRGYLFRVYSARLLLFSLIYSFLQVTIPFVWVELVVDEAVCMQHFLILMSAFLAIFSFNFFMVLLVNLFAIKLGSVLGFVCAYGILLFSFELSTDATYPLLYFLPSEIATRYEMGSDETVWEFFAKNSGQWISLVVMAVYIVVMLIIGSVWIKRMDVGLEEKENMV